MLLTLVFICLFLVCVFVIDDLVIDCVAFVKKLGPKELKADDLANMNSLPEKNIAIVIANWHEHEVIGRMVTGNIKQIQYKNYQFFLGVYPNDIETRIAAENASAAFSNVHEIVNSKMGPTSKGQMLNELVRGVLAYERKNAIKFDVFLMHDSEDIIHPLSLKMINSEITKTDFLQIPIFSFDRPVKEWIGSTYIDEFSELHTKDLLVRQYLGAPVPSAGVGTALQRNLLLTLMERNDGDFLREDSLTEDYVLGMSSAIQGFRTAFCCYYIKNKENKNEFIATREFFPNQFQAAVRQKTRWILGIVMQGTKIIPWQGSLIHKYFLYRDRRGPANSFVAMMTTALTIYLLTFSFINGHYPDFMLETWFKVGSVIATLGMLNRMFHRLKAVVIVNGWKRVWAVILRWPIGNLVNFLASIRAIRDYQRASLKKVPLKWTKTTHELPAGFGDQNELR
jgi:bacteriophage N4 adsorption protein B